MGINDPRKCDKCEGKCYFIYYCGAHVCDNCGNHLFLDRCFCGWSSSGWDGRRELIEYGEQIDDDY